ncbi:c-type cytochrome [candidate division KSB1 bacterium]
MKKSLLLSLVAVLGLSLVILYSCGGSQEGEEATTEEPAAEEQAVVEEPEEEINMELGEQIYKEKCIVCHMENGQGVPGAFPPLANSDYLLEDKVRAVSQVLNGSNEEIVVNGETYMAPMVPQVDTKEEAVAIINYVLNNFGNDGGTVTLEDVADVVINPREE